MDNSASASDPAGYPFRVRVLAVEEDPTCLTTLTLMLQRCGFEATAKASPEEALRELQMNPDSFDLVLTVADTRGNGMDGFGLLKHLKNRLPVVLFSGNEPVKTVKRAILAGASDFLVKPLRDKDIQNIWKHVVQWRRTATNGADLQKRGSAGVLHDSDEGGSKKAEFNSSPQLQATIVKAAQELRGTKVYSSRRIQELLATQGVEVTTDQVTKHMEKYIRESPAMPFPGSSHYNNSKNYSATGSSEVYMRSQGEKNVNQTSVRSNGVSLLGVGALLENESYRASHVGHLHNHGNNATGGCDNGNCNGNANMVSASPSSHLAQPVQQAMPNTDLFPSNMMGTMDNPNPATQQAFPQISRLSYNGSTGGIALSPWPVDDDGGLMRSYQLGENQVMQNTAITGMTQGTHGHGAAGQTSASQTQDLSDIFSWESTEGITGMTQGTHGHGAAGQTSASQTQDLSDLFSWESTEGITGMTQGTHGHGAAGQTSASQTQDLSDLFSWESTEGITGMTQGTHGHGAAGQTSASQTQDLSDIFSWESTEGNGEAGTSGGTDEVMECALNEDGIDSFFRY